MLGLRDFCARARAQSAPVSRAELATLLRSLRVHFFLFPVTSAWAGAAQRSGEPAAWRVTLVSLAVALGWGAGQLLNDIHDATADARTATLRLQIRGELPGGLAVLGSAALGCIAALLITLVHPHGYYLALMAVPVLLSYNIAKRWPLFGNVAYATLAGLAVLTGALATSPDQRLWSIALRLWPVVLLVGAFSALYVQANYEKDLSGDRLAGYRTLAELLTIRYSALLRLFGWLLALLLAIKLSYAPSLAGLVLLVLGSVLFLLSCGLPIIRDDERSALAGYRFAAHGLLLATLAGGEEAITTWGMVAAAVAGAWLLERAFRKLRNP